LSRNAFVSALMQNKSDFSETEYNKRYYEVSWNFLWHELHIAGIRTGILCRSWIYYERPNTRMKWWLSEIGEIVAILVLICYTIKILKHLKEERVKEIEVAN